MDEASGDLSVSIVHYRLHVLLIWMWAYQEAEISRSINAVKEHMKELKGEDVVSYSDVGPSLVTVL